MAMLHISHCYLLFTTYMKNITMITDHEMMLVGDMRIRCMYNLLPVH